MRHADQEIASDPESHQPSGGPAATVPEIGRSVRSDFPGQRDLGDRWRGVDRHLCLPVPPPQASVDDDPAGDEDGNHRVVPRRRDNPQKNGRKSQGRGDGNSEPWPIHLHLVATRVDQPPPVHD